MRVKSAKNTETMKKEIITAATSILKTEGLDALSMRKIAKELKCTPGALYHYYENKDAILLAITKEGYQDIISIIHNVDVKLPPEEQIKNIFREYINYMLEHPTTFKIILGNRIDAIKSSVNVLDKGIARNRESIAALVKMIEVGILNKDFYCINVEATAQIIWTSVYGLISRMIIEEQIDSEQQNVLIESLLSFIIFGLKGGNTNE